MRRLLRHGPSVLGLGILVFGASSGVLFAAESTPASGNGFRISPVRSEVIIEKGKSSTITVTIENPTEIKTLARAVINDFVASDKEDGEARLILDENATAPKNSFKKLVQSIPDVDLGPREKRDIQVKVSVPEDAASGGYYGAIRFAPTAASSGGNVSLTASVGSIVLVTVPGNLTEKMDLLQFGASQNGNFKSFLTGGNVDVAVRLKNSGDIHLMPFGKVQVKNMFGKVVKEFEINASKGNVLPDSIRRYEESIGKPSGGLGRYTVIANIGYSQGSGNIIDAKSTFWYMPWWAIGVIVALLAAIVGAVLVGVRRMRGGSVGSRRK